MLQGKRASKKARKLAVKAERELKKHVENPTNDAPENNKGRLQSIAAKVLMQILYAGRMARFDLLRAICHLACNISKWTSEGDRRLHRLMCYVHSSLHILMVGWVGDELADVAPHLFADADFSRCTTPNRSTNTAHLSTI